MLRQPSSEKKRWIHFQFGVRKRMRTDLIVVGSLVAVSFLLMPIMGMINALACAMGVITVFISTWHDFTLEPVKNLCILTVGIIGVILTAFLGYGLFPEGSPGYITMMTVSTFGTFFLVIYFFTSEEKGNFYMPLLLNFSAMLYAPVTGEQLFIRIGIFFGFIGAIILFQLALYKNKFRKKIRTQLNHTISLSKTQTDAILTREPKPLLQQRSIEIRDSLLNITREMGPTLARLSKWQAGHDVMRTVHILQRINTTLTASYVDGSEQMTRELHNLLKDMFEAIDRFESDQITEQEVIRQFDLLFSHLDNNATGAETTAALQAELEDFLSGEIRHEGTEALRPSLWERIREHVNLYNLIFATKASTVAALGVLITCLFHMENASMFIMTIAVLAQPYVEVGTQKVRLRIINTLFALGIFLVAFSIPGSIWAHMVILMALILIGDMFFQFETNVIGSTMLAVISRTAVDPTLMFPITLYRLSFVAAAGIILLLVDALILPKRLSVSLDKRLYQSLEANQPLRTAILAEQYDSESVKSLILEKRKINQQVMHINQFVKNPDVSAFLTAEECWLNRLTLINHRIQLSDNPDASVRQALSEVAQQTTSLTASDIRQKSILSSLNDVFDEITQSEQLVAPIYAAS